MKRELWIASIENELLNIETREFNISHFMETEEYKRLDIRQKELLELEHEITCFLHTLIEKRLEIARR